MAIALNDVADQPLAMQAGALAVVGLRIDRGRLSAWSALIVKMDDIGLHMAQRRDGRDQALGRGLVMAMPVVLEACRPRSASAAMLWVGGGILVHGLEHFHLTGHRQHWVESLSHWAGGRAGDRRGHRLAGLGRRLGGGGPDRRRAIVGVLHLIPRKECGALGRRLSLVSEVAG